MKKTRLCPLQTYCNVSATVAPLQIRTPSPAIHRRGRQYSIDGAIAILTSSGVSYYLNPDSAIIQPMFLTTAAMGGIKTLAT